LIDQIKSKAVLVGINRTRELWDEEHIISKVESGELGGYAYEGGQIISPDTYSNVKYWPTRVGKIFSKMSRLDEWNQFV